jgi:ABC-2 type transport system ATP-binding protein
VIIIDHGRLFFDGPLSAIIDRFATHKVLSFSFAKPNECDLSAAGETLERSAQSVRLKVARAKVTEVCREILGGCDVTDIAVEEPPVEDVIRELFQQRHEN